MLLIKRICETLMKPVFEVMQYPASELEYWALFFSINDHKDEPIIVQKPATLAETKQGIKELLS